MARLLRVKGEGGVIIYSGYHFSEKEAMECYVEETGYVPREPIQQYDFDEITASDLLTWIKEGE